MKGNEVIYKGKSYKGIPTLCKDLGLCSSSVVYRLHKGENLEDIVDYLLEKKNQNKDISIVYRGKRYNSRKALCRELEISQSSVILRMEKGHSFEDCIEYYLRKKNSPITYIGKVYNSLQDLSKDIGLPNYSIHSSLQRRMNKGMTFEKAIDDIKRYQVQGVV